MTDEEKKMIEAENQFPLLSGVAFQHAREEVLKSGESILVSDEGAIFEVSPTGERKFLKSIDPPVHLSRLVKVTLP